MIALALYCACGCALVADVHERAEPQFRDAWGIVHSRRARCRPIAADEWRAVRLGQVRELAEVLCEQGAPEAAAAALADAVWGIR